MEDRRWRVGVKESCRKGRIYEEESRSRSRWRGVEMEKRRVGEE